MCETLSGLYRLQIPGGQFALSTDSMVLADFCRVRAGQKILDLGCGCGALSLLLLAKEPTLSLLGLEVQPQAAQAARENAQRNALSGRFSVLEGDLRDGRTLLGAQRFDAVVCNPPYYPAGSGAQRAQPQLQTARSEISCSLEDICRCTAYALRWGGAFFLVHKPERLTDVLLSLRNARLEPKRLQLVRHTPEARVSLVLVEARLGGRPGLELLQDLTLYHTGGAPTADCRRIYHMQEEA